MKKFLVSVVVLMLMAVSANAKPVMDFSVMCANGDAGFNSPIYRVGLASGNPDGFVLKTNAEFGKDRFGTDVKQYSLTADYSFNNKKPGNKNAFFTVGAGGYKLDVDGVDTHNKIKFGGFAALNAAILEDVYLEVKYTELGNGNSYDGFQYGINCRL